jgi:DNA-binding response OmpR family regulator
MPKKILFVEDDEAFFATYSIPLTAKGYAVIHVNDGSQAVDKALTEKPDLVLLDIVLPGISGLDILKDLKSNPATEDIHVVMMTNFSNDTNVQKAVELGADDYFMKFNVVPDELPSKIAVFIGEPSTAGINVI